MPCTQFQSYTPRPQMIEMYKRIIFFPDTLYNIFLNKRTIFGLFSRVKKNTENKEGKETEPSMCRDTEKVSLCLIYKKTWKHDLY